MKHTALILSFALATAPLALRAQSFTSSSLSTETLVAESTGPEGTGVSSPAQMKAVPAGLKPLSRIAFSGGIGVGGINLQAATNLNRHMNIRGTGNVFKYTANNISTNGFNVTGNLNFATAGASVDVYPFPNHGFRLSPGVQLYNQNQVAVTGSVASGQSISLNDQDYYSANASSGPGATPITVNGNLGLNSNKRAFTMTTGWGNAISRRGGHWSFPVELGAAFVGSPTVALNLSGWACTDPQLTQCANLMDTNQTISSEVQTNLTAQIAKWKSDLDPLKVYPIFSFGLAYNFRVR